MPWYDKAGKAAIGTAKGFGGASNLAANAGVLYSAIKSAVPRLEDEVIVEIVGQPGAKKKQLYYLALATAFGLVRRFDISINGTSLAVPTGFLMIEYDAADHWVRATIKFNTGLTAAAANLGAGQLIGSILGGAVFGAIGSIFGPLGTVAGTLIGGFIFEEIGKQIDDYRHQSNPGNTFYDQAVVYSGPQETVVGGEFNFTGLIAAATPTNSRSPGAPQLPFAGFPILTSSPTINVQGTTFPSINPNPPGDNRSRGTKPEPYSQNSTDNGLDSANTPNVLNRKLIPLVFAALSDPGGTRQMTFISPQQGPGGR